MPLNQAQRAMVQKARSIGAGGQGVALSEGACSYIVGTVAADLGLKASFPEIPEDLPPFFSDLALGSLEVSGVSFLPLLERLVDLAPDADSYFASLAKLHKSRLKCEQILQTQAIPGPEHVGPRVLLEYGRMNPSALGAYLFWRKWLFDITPVLVVLDSTPNPKLRELIQAFESQAGESYVGVEAWDHLNSMAGRTMGKFLDLYVHRPIAAVMGDARQSLAPLTVRMDHNEITVDLGEESFKIHRRHEAVDAETAALLDDVDEEALGP